LKSKNPFLPTSHSAARTAPFGETAARFGVVADVDGVARGIEDNLMHSDYFAFAEGGDFESVAGGLFDDVLEYGTAVPEGASSLWT
jgi:hypothetical protein